MGSDNSKPVSKIDESVREVVIKHRIEYKEVAKGGGGIMQSLKEYFANLTSDNPVKLDEVKKAEDVINNKVKLNSFVEDSLFDLTTGLKKEALPQYAAIHIDPMEISDSRTKDLIKNVIIMADSLDSSNPKIKKITFQNSQFMNYCGYLYVQRSPDDPDKFNIGYCIVNIQMTTIGNIEFEPWEINLIKDQFMYHKVLNCLKQQDMIDNVPTSPPQ